MRTVAQALSRARSASSGQARDRAVRPPQPSASCRCPPGPRARAASRYRRSRHAGADRCGRERRLAPAALAHHQPWPSARSYRRQISSVQPFYEPATARPPRAGSSFISQAGNRPAGSDRAKPSGDSDATAKPQRLRGFSIRRRCALRRYPGVITEREGLTGQRNARSPTLSGRLPPSARVLPRRISPGSAFAGSRGDRLILRPAGLEGMPWPSRWMGYSLSYCHSPEHRSCLLSGAPRLAMAQCHETTPQAQAVAAAQTPNRRPNPSPPIQLKHSWLTGADQPGVTGGAGELERDRGRGPGLGQVWARSRTTCSMMCWSWPSAWNGCPWPGPGLAGASAGRGCR